jgi:hypothetical protein
MNASTSLADADTECPPLSSPILIDKRAGVSNEMLIVPDIGISGVFWIS